MQKQNTFDIIIIGDGCASWMLLEALSHFPNFSELSILLLGAGENMDRSWCFWDHDMSSPYKEMIQSTWREMSFVSDDYHKREILLEKPYHYIPGKSFFNYFKKDFLLKHPQITYKSELVTAISGESGNFNICTSKSLYHTPQAYNSGWMPEVPTIEIWQHFRGWFVEFQEDVFDYRNATLMDFNVPQDEGCSFMYVLPLSNSSALIELTFFSTKIFDLETYENLLRDYITKNYGQHYKITHREFGKIPMQQGVFKEKGACGEIQIGTLGGMVKASTGFAFQRIREDSVRLAKAYFDGNTPKRFGEFTRFAFYDALLLWIIKNEPTACKAIFTQLFRKQKISLVTRFMDEKTNIWQEIFIFAQLPIVIFLKALWFRFVLKSNH